MDLDGLPKKALLRWEFMVRIVLAVSVPLLINVMVAGDLVGGGAWAALVAVLVSLSYLGKDLGDLRWSIISVIGAPVALVLGVALAGAIAPGLLFVFALYVWQGVMMQAGRLADLAWFPVSSAGLLAVVLGQDSVQNGASIASVAAGGAWAFALMVVVPIIVRPPLLPIPAAALAPDRESIRLAVTSPTFNRWAFPLLGGTLAAGLLVVADWLTGGFKPYWAVFALVSVLGPTAAQTKKSAAATVMGSGLGVVVAGLLLIADLPAAASVTIAVLLGAVGALLLLVAGVLSKALITPLPVVLAALAIGTPASSAIGWRFAQFVLGAGVAFAVAGLAERLSRRLVEEREAAAEEDDHPVG